MDLAERECEIVRLREVENWTFRTIAPVFGISSNRASQIYHRAQRKRREAKRRLLSRPENKVELSFLLTRGEAIVLEKILSAVLAGELNFYLQIDPNKSDPDYLYAEELYRRLFKIINCP